MSIEIPDPVETRGKRRVATAIVLGAVVISAAGIYGADMFRNHSENPQTSLLERYERETGVAPKTMDFITMPSSEAEAREQAAALARTLKSFDKAGVEPIVIMEPTLDSGDHVDLTELSKGTYDKAIDTYFSSLKEAGITDKQMGTWVPLPEANLPEWIDGITDPELFTKNITKVAGSIKQYFPASHVSIMLDSTTHTSPDPSYTHGSIDTNALMPYLDIKPGLIDSFGLQGFTYNETDSPKDYLNGDMAVAAAHKLGVKNVWFNTGTYAETYNPDNKNSPLKATSDRRSIVLDGALAQAEVAQKAGLTVDMINLFAENTYDGTDGSADFSYTSSEDKAALKAFVTDAHEQHIPVTLFDPAK